MGFFIQNHPATLDQAGEWYYNATTKTVRLYSSANPNSQTITATANDKVIDLDNAAFIRIQNLHITQARRANLYAQNSSNLVLHNNDFTDSGEDGVIIEGTGSTVLIEKTTVANCNNNGVYIGAYQNVTVRESTIRHVGLLPGRGKSGDGNFTGFQSFATRNTLIENNIIDSTGYLGLHIQTKTTVRQNQISNFCMIKSDGGGIYLWNGSQQPTDSIFIESNLIRSGIGTAGGLSDNTVSGAHGIFLDDCMDGVNITDNTISDCQGLGIYLHAVSRVNLLRNTCFNNSLAQLILYNYGGPCLPRNNVLQQNILLAKTAQQGVVGYISSYDDLRSFGQMEQNYYARPFNDMSTIRAVYNQNIVADLNLSQWQAQFGQDLTSNKSSVSYKEYRVNKVNPVNRITDSSVSNSDGWQTWSMYNNGQATWGNGGQLPTDRLTISFAHSSGRADSYVLVYKGIRAVEKAKTYLVRFVANSPVHKKMLVFIRQRQSPYQDLSHRYEFMAGPTPASYEFALTVTADEADALLTFQLGEDMQPVWLDTIRLQEATIEPVNPDDLIQLVYNPTTKDSLITLTNAYRDVKNKYYARYQRVLLKPFSSLVLLRDTVTPAAIDSVLVTATDPLEPQVEKNRVYPNPTTDEFMFVADDDILRFQLVDLLGRERLSHNSVRRGQLVRFGLLLPDDSYMLHIQYKTGEQRLVKLLKTSK